MTEYIFLSELFLKNHKVRKEQERQAHRDKEWTSKSRPKAWKQHFTLYNLIKNIYLKKNTEGTQSQLTDRPNLKYNRTVVRKFLSLIHTYTVELTFRHIRSKFTAHDSKHKQTKRPIVPQTPERTTRRTKRRSRWSDDWGKCVCALGGKYWPSDSKGGGQRRSDPNSQERRSEFPFSATPSIVFLFNERWAIDPGWGREEGGEPEP